jgi:DUF4097 and DUF4098 domain-containing protein YvlB
MPPQPGTDPQREPARTAPQYRPDTNPVYTPPGAGSYQPPTMPPAVRQQFYPPAAPAKGRSSWGWIIGLISFGLIGALVLTVVLVSRVVRNNSGRPGNTPVASARGGEKNFGELGVEGRSITVTGDETTIKQSFPLTSNSKFSLNIASGEVKIEAWDQPVAEVQVVKRGGSRNDRPRSRVFYNDSGGDLSFRFDQGGARNVEVEVYIKLPRVLKQVILEGTSAELDVAGINSEVVIKTTSGSTEISNIKGSVTVSSQSGGAQISNVEGNVTSNTASGSLSLSNITGRVDANSASGDIELEEIAGPIKANTASGDLSATIVEVPSGEPVEFNAASGDIELKFEAPINFNFEARTVSGEIRLDGIPGINIEKQTPGERANGRIGNGGPPLTVKTASGDISVSIDGEQPAASEPTKTTQAPEGKQQPDQTKAKQKGN